MSETILVVDDEDDIREIARLALQRIGGFEVLTSDNGVAAAEVAAREQPDAVLLDVMMPGMDGPATLAALREEPSSAHIPVVFLTAKARESDREALLAAGAAGVITKPFDPMALAAVLRETLGWTR